MLVSYLEEGRKNVYARKKINNPFVNFIVYA